MLEAKLDVAGNGLSMRLRYFLKSQHLLCEVKQSPGNNMWGLSASTDGETDMHVSVALPFGRCCWGDAVAQTNVAHKEPTSNKGNQPDKTLFLVHTVKAKFSETQTAKATSFSGLQTESKAKPQEKPCLWKQQKYQRTRAQGLIFRLCTLYQFEQSRIALNMSLCIWHAGWSSGSSLKKAAVETEAGGGKLLGTKKVHRSRRLRLAHRRNNTLCCPSAGSYTAQHRMLCSGVFHFAFSAWQEKVFRHTQTDQAITGGWKLEAAEGERLESTTKPLRWDQRANKTILTVNISSYQMNSVMDGSLPFLALIKLRLLFTFIFVAKTHLMLRYKVTVKVRVCGWTCKHLQSSLSLKRTACVKSQI